MWLSVAPESLSFLRTFSNFSKNMLACFGSKIKAGNHWQFLLYSALLDSPEFEELQMVCSNALARAHSAGNNMRFYPWSHMLSSGSWGHPHFKINVFTRPQSDRLVATTSAVDALLAEAQKNFSSAANRINIFSNRTTPASYCKTEDFNGIRTWIVGEEGQARVLTTWSPMKYILFCTAASKVSK